MHFLDRTFYISIQISLTFVPKVSAVNKFRKWPWAEQSAICHLNQRWPLSLRSQWATVILWKCQSFFSLTLALVNRTGLIRKWQKMTSLYSIILSLGSWWIDIQMEGWRDGAGHDNTHQLDRGGGYNWHNHDFAGIILCMRPANERRRYTVTSSPIGWAHAQNDPWFGFNFTYTYLFQIHIH